MGDTGTVSRKREGIRQILIDVLLEERRREYRTLATMRVIIAALAVTASLLLGRVGGNPAWSVALPYVLGYLGASVLFVMVASRVEYLRLRMWILIPTFDVPLVFSVLWAASATMPVVAALG